MLNIFPVQFLAPLAYMILRVVLGLIFIHFGRSHIKNRELTRDLFIYKQLPFRKFFTWYVAIIEIVVGLLFILGLFTQIAALVAMIYSFKFIVLHKHMPGSFLSSRIMYVLIFFTSLSLFITGAGAFAFDLPI